MAQPTYSPTATVHDLFEEVKASSAFGGIPLIVVVDGDSRPVVGFAYWEDREDEYHLTGWAFVLMAGSHDDPHPMWINGLTPEAIAFHEREAASDPA